MSVYAAQPGSILHSAGAARIRAIIKAPGKNGIPKHVDPIRVTMHFTAPDGEEYKWGYPTETNPPEYSLATRIDVGIYEVAQPLLNKNGKWKVEVAADGGSGGTTEIIFESVDM